MFIFEGRKGKKEGVQVLQLFFEGLSHLNTYLTLGFFLLFVLSLQD